MSPRYRALVGGALDDKPFEVGDEIELEPDVAESWVEQGLVEDPDPRGTREAELNAMTKPELVEVDPDLVLPKMTKAELVDAILESEGF